MFYVMLKTQMSFFTSSINIPSNCCGVVGIAYFIPNVTAVTTSKSLPNEQLLMMMWANHLKWFMHLFCRQNMISLHHKRDVSSINTWDCHPHGWLSMDEGMIRRNFGNLRSILGGKIHAVLLDDPRGYPWWFPKDPPKFWWSSMFLIFGWFPKCFIQWSSHWEGSAQRSIPRPGISLSCKWRHKASRCSDLLEHPGQFIRSAENLLTKMPDFLEQVAGNLVFQPWKSDENGG